MLQGSLFLVNVWQIGCALSPNFTSVIVFRGLGGLSSAGGSVTLGMVGSPQGRGQLSLGKEPAFYHEQLFRVQRC